MSHDDGRKAPKTTLEGYIGAKRPARRPRGNGSMNFTRVGEKEEKEKSKKYKLQEVIAKFVSLLLYLRKIQKTISN